MTKSTTPPVSGLSASDPAVLAGTPALFRPDFIIGLVVSFAILFGAAWIGQLTKGHQPHPLAKAAVPTVEVIVLPPIQPDPPEVDDNTPAPMQDLAPPMLNEEPQPAALDSFVQPLQPPPPVGSVTDNNLLKIPDNFNLHGGPPVFDASQLDQQAVPTVQARPNYPFDMRRAGISGQVVVDFIVDPSGHVRSAFAASSSQREFEAAAVQAVAKWRFRAGRKDGKAVNTHMQVPVVFSLNTAE